MRHWFTAVFVAAVLAGAAASAQPQANEADLKAALVLRLAKYVTWPVSRDPAGEPPLTVCVVGQHPIGASLRALATDPARVEVRRMAGDAGDLLRCHIVVFASETEVDVNYALARLAGHPVLTIGATERFARGGGVLALVNRDDRIAFVVNNEAARRAGLAVSSRLLKIASVVQGARP